MKLTTRGSLAAVLACMATAVAAAPAVAGTTVPVGLPLEALETAVPVEAPKLSTGVPVPVPGAPDGPRYVTGNLLPQNTVPTVPIAGELPRTLLEVPVENPVGEGNLGVAQAVSEESDLKLASPGATLGAPLSQPAGEGLGLPEPTLPQAALIAPALQGAPTAGLLFG
ncbi:hypothetical protein ABZ070_35090 [Streptomyces sp. NPDC006283]|uniref:hypothetical protein n=1 Tax=Streptomyces sp. NPDC006283 TaxID=3156741 RepID=UPI0033AFF73E